MRNRKKILHQYFQGRWFGFSGINVGSFLGCQPSILFLHFMCSSVLSKASQCFIIKWGSLTQKESLNGVLFFGTNNKGTDVKVADKTYCTKGSVSICANWALYMTPLVNGKQSACLCHLLSCVCAKCWHRRVKTVAYEHCSVLILTWNPIFREGFLRVSKLKKMLWCF